MSNHLSEELIKNNLYSIGLQENRFNSQEFLLTYQKSHYLPDKSYSFREISDWSNRYRIQQDAQENKPEELNKKDEENRFEYSKFSYLISKRHRKEPEKDQGCKKKMNIELSPINVKFHSQNNKNIFRRSGGNSPRKMPEENSGSFYESNYEPLALLYEIKTREKRSIRPSKKEELPLLLPQFNELKLPKTQRVSSIMRLMKKHQQIRAYRHKRVSPSPEGFDGIIFPADK